MCLLLALRTAFTAPRAAVRTRACTTAGSTTAHRMRRSRLRGRLGKCDWWLASEQAPVVCNARQDLGGNKAAIVWQCGRAYWG
eukprot:365461-Chlamydomonas_euryale.AAC.1